jgi:hypothetical protein
MAIHTIVISAASPGRFNVQLDGDARLFVESTDLPFLESAAALLASGLALPEDMLVMKFSGTAFEIRRGKLQDAVKTAVGRPPMRLIAGKSVAQRARTRRIHSCGNRVLIACSLGEFTEGASCAFTIV